MKTPNSMEQLRTLAKMSTHGTVFTVIGVDHFSLDDAYMEAEFLAKKKKMHCGRRRKLEVGK